MANRRSLQVLLESSSYAPGETVRGTVELVLSKPLRTRGVRVYLVGTELTEISISRWSGHTRSNYTYNERDEVISQGYVLYGGQPVGAVKAIGEALASLAHAPDYPVLPAGRHRYPFEFTLPDEALPSWNGDYSTISYSIRAEVDVPVGKDLQFNGVLYVIPPESWTIAPSRRAERRLPGGLLRSLQVDVSMDLELRGCPLRWKERLEGRLLIRNQSEKKIRGATVSILSIENAQAGGYDRESTTTVLKGFFKIPDPEATEHEVRFGFVLDPLPAPYQGRYSRVGYWLRAELNVKFAGNPVLEVPLEIV